MTLIASLSGPHAAVMVSDRLVTVADRNTGLYIRNHDRESNKNIVLIMRDAVVAIGYTGLAYIDGKHTDNWIAEIASPGAHIFSNLASAMYGFKAPSRLRLHQFCNRLRQGLMAEGVGTSISILMAGWRFKKNRLVPISIVISGSAFGSDPNARLNARREPGTTVFAHVGAHVSLAEFDGALQSIAGRSFNEEAGRDMLTTLIRSKAAIDSSVGPHVMALIIYHPTAKRIDCRFDPLQSHFANRTIDGQQGHLVVGYSPWILTPNTFVAPTQTSGSGFGTWEANGWTIDVTDVSRGRLTPSAIGWSVPQTRTPPLR